MALAVLVALFHKIDQMEVCFVCVLSHLGSCCAGGPVPQNRPDVCACAHMFVHLHTMYAGGPVPDNRPDGGVFFVCAHIDGGVFFVCAHIGGGVFFLCVLLLSCGHGSCCAGGPVSQNRPDGGVLCVCAHM